jgi:hypothetical protein
MVMFQRLRTDPNYEISKRIVAKVHEEIFVRVHKNKRERFRNILSHRPANVGTVMLYLNGRLLFQGANRDYQIEGQSIFIRSGLMRTGDHVLVANYDYLGDL